MTKRDDKMPVGFRKSLFGFNSDDVMEYIEKTHKEFVEKEVEFKEKIDDLSKELDNTKTQITEILGEKAVLENELKEYTDKYDEIERLSQNIGRLYLVAETNANAVMESAKLSRDISQDEVSKNIACADKTFDSLSSLKDEITRTSAEFTARIQTLMSSLEKTKRDIYNNNNLAEQKIEEYENLLNSIKV